MLAAVASQQQYVCPGHSGDAYLTTFIKEAVAADPDLRAKHCSFCDSLGAVALEELAKVVQAAIERFYNRALEAGVPWDSEDKTWGWPVIDTDDALSDLDPEFDDAVDAAVREMLEPEDWVPEYDPDISPTQRLRDAWADFATHVQHRSRFQLAPDQEPDAYDPFPQIARSDVLKTVSEVITRLGLIERLGPGDRLFRARTYEGDKPFQYAHELVAPPAEKASQGRMNPAGIPYLYGALSAEVAAAEVYDGREHVAVCTLTPLRALTVVNLGHILQLSPFDPDTKPLDVYYSGFLNGFVREITRPFTRDDRVHYEYTPTQFFTEFLRWRLDPRHRVDGIVYPSARAAGSNIVVFCGPDGCLTDDQRPREHDREEEQLVTVAGTIHTFTYGAPAVTNQGTYDLRSTNNS